MSPITGHPDVTGSYLDLAASPPGHLSADSLGFRTPEGVSRSDAQNRENEVAEPLVLQFLAADVVVIGAPLYNFGIPTQLMAWIDRISQLGRTFSYTGKGAVGLAGGKTVIVASARGGLYLPSAAGNANEHRESYLKVIFSFMGVTCIRFLRAESLAMGDAAKAAGITEAGVQITVQTTAVADQSSTAVAA